MALPDPLKFPSHKPARREDLRDFGKSRRSGLRRESSLLRFLLPALFHFGTMPPLGFGQPFGKGGNITLGIIA
ncbi:MAG: hypothetical protein Fur002_12300 [Anaerolineales bacterium]